MRCEYDEVWCVRWNMIRWEMRCDVMKCECVGIFYLLVCKP